MRFLASLLLVAGIAVLAVLLEANADATPSPGEWTIPGADAPQPQRPTLGPDSLLCDVVAAWIETRDGQRISIELFDPTTNTTFDPAAGTQPPAIWAACQRSGGV